MLLVCVNSKWFGGIETFWDKKLYLQIIHYHWRECLIWEINCNCVAARFCNSMFMGKATAKDVFNFIVTCFSGINNSKML